jgi:hypothetical protein
MKCGNNLESLSYEGLSCHTCGMDSGFIQVTEENKHTIPFPTHPYEYSDIDPNLCNDKEGICPCGVYTAHLINKRCNLIETAIAKEPLYPHCQCKSSLSPCGHSISHRLVDPCTGQL